MENNILWMKTKKDMLKGLPKCWFKTWGDFLDNVLIVPKGRAQLLEQPLFLNQNITREGTMIYYKKWWDVGIRQIKDVLYEAIE